MSNSISLLSFVDCWLQTTITLQFDFDRFNYKFKMENTLNMCLTCLSNDRRLVPLHKIRHFSEEFNFIEVNKQIHPK